MPRMKPPPGDAKPHQYITLTSPDLWTIGVEYRLVDYITANAPEKWAGDAMLLYLFYRTRTMVAKQDEVWATLNFIAAGLCWSEDRVKRIRKLLREMELVELYPLRDGDGRAVRWITEVRLPPLTEKSGFPTSRKSLRIKGEYSREEGEPSVSPKQSVSNEDLQEYRPVMTRLHGIISDVFNVKINPAKEKATLDAIRKLHTIDGVSTKRMMKALIYYAGHVGGKYDLVIQSGSAFRDKFPRLELAMRKANGNEPISKQEKTKPKTTPAWATNDDIYDPELEEL